jgi:uncharacterized protein (DUF433 family)
VARINEKANAVSSRGRERVLATPAYPFVEAAHYLHLPLSTLRAWCLGQPLSAEGVSRRFQPLIRLDGGQGRALSFLNLVEAHVLAAIRRQHHVSLPAVRRALDFVGRRLRSARPLAELQFQTDGVDLFVDRVGTLINVSREGQTEMAEVIRAHLQRIERDAKGIPVRLFLFTRSDERGEQPASVVVDPRIAFGRPVLAGRGVPTAVLADRFKAGDSFQQLAEDYETSPQAIEEALRCELDRKAA